MVYLIKDGDFLCCHSELKVSVSMRTSNHSAMIVSNLSVFKFSSGDIIEFLGS